RFQRRRVQHRLGLFFHIRPEVVPLSRHLLFTEIQTVRYFLCHLHSPLLSSLLTLEKKLFYFFIKKTSVSVLLGQKLNAFCGATRFGAWRPLILHIQPYMLPW